MRTIKTAKKLGIRTISIYTPADATSLHVSEADEAVLLPGSNSSAYTEGDEIIKIANEKKADAIIPGYGFLSENADFARSVGKAGMVWVGPSPESIEGRISELRDQIDGIADTAQHLASNMWLESLQRKQVYRLFPEQRD